MSAYANALPDDALQVEVIRTERTDDETVDALLALCKTMKKTPVRCKDTPGCASHVFFARVPLCNRLVQELIMLSVLRLLQLRRESPVSTLHAGGDPYG